MWLEIIFIAVFSLLCGLLVGWLLFGERELREPNELPALPSKGRYRVLLHFESGRDARKAYENAVKAEFFQGDICRGRKDADREG